MKGLFKITSILLLIFTAMIATRTSAQDSRVMIQGFNWESSKVTGGWYNIVQSKAGDLASSQIDMIWMPPPSDAAAPEGYLPRKLYTIDSEYGSDAALRSCINALHANGIEVIADIVINHRVGVTDWADFQEPAWGCWGVVANDEWGQNGGNPCGSWDTGGNYHAARDIDHSNPTVQSDLINWMNWLKNDVGFDGWRYDYVRGYSGYYNGLYNNATNPTFSVGELWDNLDINNPDAHRQQLTDWIDATGGNSTAFDFTTKGILQQAVNGELWRLNRNGQAPGLIGWWPENAVTFVDNHDTGSTQAYWPFPGDKVMQGYAYILTHPGIPTIFWDHFYDWGLYSEIKDLIAIRKSSGLNSKSQLDIQVAEANRYAAIIDGKVAMKIGSGNWSPSGSDWNLAAAGNDYAVWTKGSTITPPPPTNGETFTVHLKKPSNWNNATIYFWQDNNGVSSSTATWPGEGMTSDGDGWYSYTLNGNCSNIIFSDNGTNKTDDLSRCGDGWYDPSTDAWTDTKPATTTPPTETGSFTVYLKKPDNWSAATVYFWQENNGNPSSSTTWPGESMTNEGNGWYSYVINDGSCASIIFSDNGANQTADLYRCGDGWYDPSNNTWADNPPATTPVITDLTVYFKPNGYSNPTIYFWQADNGATTTWPGESMVDEGNGWYSYTLAGADCANIIFSNSGASQTPDLSRCGTGWYNGNWHNNNPDLARTATSQVARSKNPVEAAVVPVSNYPNPFTNRTTIQFHLVEEATVSLTIYNVLGEEVHRSLEKQVLEAGNQAITFEAGNLKKGIYLYKLKVGDTTTTKRMMIK